MTLIYYLYEGEAVKKFPTLAELETNIHGPKWGATVEVYKVDVVNATENKVCGLLYHPSYNWMTFHTHTTENGVMVDRMAKYGVTGDMIK